VPFTASLVGENPHNGVAAAVYVGMVMITACLLAAIWWVALRYQLVAQAATPEIVRATGRRLWLVIGVMLAAALIAPFFPQAAIVVMLLAIGYVVVTTGSRALVD
jgi:uncharacterized membrane protein